jgi:hypothetical protein
MTTKSKVKSNSSAEKKKKVISEATKQDARSKIEDILTQREFDKMFEL